MIDLMKSQENKNSYSLSQKNYDIIVFCHLRWDFVYQRPQHILTRLSQDYRILFVEEPIQNLANENQVFSIHSNLDVLQPCIPDIEELGNTLQDFLKGDTVSIGWFYSSNFVEIFEKINFNYVIYDCMDELSLFKGAPEGLVEREKKLLRNTDIVFTGGKSLYHAKKKLHPKVFCFPSSVDYNHFAQPSNGNMIPEELSNIPTPIVGYCGVIDERIDLELLYQAAFLLPDVSFVMVGPVVKIDEKDLPREKNIHYLGMQSYESIPYFLKGFDIAMMPFALNEATEYISPTKTLEYMAAGKPIISTAIKDVIRDYSSCIRIIRSCDDFIREINLILNDTARSYLPAYERILLETSWDTTVEKMKEIIKEELAI